MILPKHPDLMSDQELAEWVHGLVTRKEPESIFLDYKATIATGSRPEKLEIAKDVSSFANERGGVVLYGIPEERKSDEPVPVDVSDIGMEPVPGLSQVIEDILVGALIPQLPELRVREVQLVEPPDKIVYLVWHPESWDAPHMVHAYGEKRYYKRGNFRSVLMEEGEVERLYSRRQMRRALATEFLDKIDYGEWVLPQEGRLVKVVVCPSLPFESRVDFSHKAMREWLQRYNLKSRSGWQPFIEGVRNFVKVSGAEEYQAEHRLFRNGAGSFYSDVVAFEENAISGYRFLKHLERFLHLIEIFYQQINMSGDVLIDVALFDMEDKIVFEIYGKNHQWHSGELQFRVTASAMDIITESGRWALEQRIMDRLTQCFGVWSVPEYFNQDGSPYRL